MVRMGMGDGHSLQWLAEPLDRGSEGPGVGHCEHAVDRDHAVGGLTRYALTGIAAALCL
jgi:hypothetical protein